MVSDAGESDTLPRVPSVIIKFGYIWSYTFIPLVWLLNWGDPIGRAIIGMAMGLIVIWTTILAYLQYRFRDRVQTFIYHKNYPRGIVFVLFCIAMAMLEEAVTTGMTNLARPVFGVSPEDAYITASTNYWEVVLLHSVVAFVPMFVVWSLMLRKYRFHYLWVYLLFGINGTLAESLSFGLENLINIGFWTNVYGLMVFLPAYTYQFREEARNPPKWMYFMALILPLLGGIPIVILLIIIHGLLGNL
jgi:hypothetical protein